MPHKLTKTQINAWINNNQDMIRKNKKKAGGSVYTRKGVKVPGMQMGGTPKYPTKGKDRLPSINEPFLRKKIADVQDKRPIDDPTPILPPSSSDLRGKIDDSNIPGSATELRDVTNEKGTHKEGVYDSPTEGGGQNFTEADWNLLHQQKRDQGIGYTGGAKNPNNPDEYGTLFDDGTFQKEGNYSDFEKKSSSDPFMKKGGPVRKYRGSTKAYKEGGAVFNRQGIRVPGMRKGK
jgi:hypothetical protein